MLTSEQTPCTLPSGCEARHDVTLLGCWGAAVLIHGQTEIHWTFITTSWIISQSTLSPKAHNICNIWFRPKLVLMYGQRISSLLSIHLSTRLCCVFFTWRRCFFSTCLIRFQRRREEAEQVATTLVSGFLVVGCSSTADKQQVVSILI